MVQIAFAESINDLFMAMLDAKDGFPALVHFFSQRWQQPYPRDPRVGVGSKAGMARGDSDGDDDGGWYSGPEDCSGGEDDGGSYSGSSSSEGDGANGNSSSEGDGADGDSSSDGDGDNDCSGGEDDGGSSSSEGDGANDCSGGEDDGGSYSGSSSSEGDGANEGDGAGVGKLEMDLAWTFSNVDRESTRRSNKTETLFILGSKDTSPALKSFVSETSFYSF
ncbi:hypothetical protein ACOSP7_008435 [Xanthoceras sorbifolium]